ncbi:MAG: hypothetical protein WBA74_00770, partial [Cyclobacteriaceae bacterium]
MSAESTHEFSASYSEKNKPLQARYEKTLNFLKSSVKREANILDLGIDNPFSQIMRDNGYKVANTSENQDLDIDYDVV